MDISIYFRKYNWHLHFLDYYGIDEKKKYNFPKLPLIKKNSSTSNIDNKNYEKIKKNMMNKYKIDLNKYQTKKTIIGKKPIPFLQPNIKIYKPFVKYNIFDRLHMMKGFSEICKNNL